MRSIRASVRSSVLAATLVLGSGAAGAVSATVTVDEPRAFGYSVGDVVMRVVTLRLPAGVELDESSLPEIARRGQAVELRRVSQRRFAQTGGQGWRLTLEYQVFLAPREVRTLELPPIVLQLRARDRSEQLRIDAWPLSVAPLAPAEASARDGLGDRRPDRPPPLIDTSPGRVRLMVYGGLLLLLLTYLAYVYGGLPWLARRRRPFTLAWRAVRKLPGAAQAGKRRDMYRLLHAALNQTAGEALFESDVDRFVTAHPQFAGLRNEIALFYRRSREEFFAAAGTDGATDTPRADDGAWLVGFCRACRDAERGSP